MMDALGYGQSALSEAGHEGIQTYGADEMHGISLLPVMRGETDTVREVAIAGYGRSSPRIGRTSIGSRTISTPTR